MKCWSIVCCPVWRNGLPFNVCSAFKSHLPIHFYRLPSITVSVLCHLTTEVNDVILWTFIVCCNLFYAAQILFFHVNYFTGQYCCFIPNMLLFLWRHMSCHCTCLFLLEALSTASIKMTTVTAPRSSLSCPSLLQFSHVLIVNHACINISG